MIKKIILILLSFVIVLSVCYFNATQINTKQIQTRQEIISSDKINLDQNELLIAYFSDLHYTNFITNEFLDKAIQLINQYEPDIIIFGGDLIDHYQINNLAAEDRQYLIDSLNSLQAKYGKYAVLGNHDLADDNVRNSVDEILMEAGFTILTNANVTISSSANSSINIVGIDSMVGGTPDIKSAFDGIDSQYYTFVVSHCPDTFEDIQNYDFDYMLAGHSHGGQIYIPIISILNKTEGCQKYFRGKYYSDNKTLDITNGVGRTLKDARFLADSEIVFYRLQSTKTDTVAQTQ